MWMLSVVAGLGTGGPWAAEGAAMRVGTAVRDITPVVGLGEPDVWLAGYGPMRKATGGAGDLSARAVTFADGTRRVAIVSLDLIGFFLDDVRKVRSAYAKAHPDKPIDYIIVCSTHTHAGPDMIGIWGPVPKTGVNPVYVAKVRDQIVAALGAAVTAERPATLRIARTEMPDLIHDSRKPIVIDQGFWLITADDADGRPIATLTNWGIHPEVLDARNTLISPDFPGVLRRQIEKVRGGTAIHISGAIGGLTAPEFPAVDDQGQAFDANRNRRVEQYGQMVARKALAALGKAEPLGAALDFRRTEVAVPLTNLYYMLGFTLGTIVRESIVIPKRPEGQPADPANPATLTTEIGLLRIGEAAIAIIPGEIYPELVIGGIQDPQEPNADFPGAPHEPLINDQLKSAKHKLVFGLANDEIGYIIPKSQWDAKPPFCYGRKTAQYGEENSCGPDVAPVLCDAFRKLAQTPASAK